MCYFQLQIANFLAVSKVYCAVITCTCRRICLLCSKLCFFTVKCLTPCEIEQLLRAICLTSFGLQVWRQCWLVVQSSSWHTMHVPIHSLTATLLLFPRCKCSVWWVIRSCGVGPAGIACPWAPVGMAVGCKKGNEDWYTSCCPPAILHIATASASASQPPAQPPPHAGAATVCPVSELELPLQHRACGVCDSFGSMHGAHDWSWSQSCCCLCHMPWG